MLPLILMAGATAAANRLTLAGLRRRVQEHRDGAPPTNRLHRAACVAPAILRRDCWCHLRAIIPLWTRRVSGGLLAVVSLLACYLSGRRAAQVCPTAALCCDY